jgi:hypothetical protein
MEERKISADPDFPVLELLFINSLQGLPLFLGVRLRSDLPPLVRHAVRDPLLLAGQQVHEILLYRTTEAARVPGGPRIGDW